MSTPFHRLLAMLITHVTDPFHLASATDAHNLFLQCLATDYRYTRSLSSTTIHHHHQIHSASRRHAIHIWSTATHTPTVTPQLRPTLPHYKATRIHALMPMPNHPKANAKRRTTDPTHVSPAPIFTCCLTMLI